MDKPEDSENEWKEYQRNARDYKTNSRLFPLRLALFIAFITLAIGTSCGAGKAASSSETAPNQPAVTIAAIPSATTQGSSSTLTVAASNATQVVISENTDSSTFTLAATGGTQKVTPTATTTYTATATGASGTATAQTTITVTVADRPSAYGHNSGESSQHHAGEFRDSYRCRHQCDSGCDLR